MNPSSRRRQVAPNDVRRWMARHIFFSHLRERRDPAPSRPSPGPLPPGPWWVWAIVTLAGIWLMSYIPRFAFVFILIAALLLGSLVKIGSAPVALD